MSKLSFLKPNLVNIPSFLIVINLGFGFLTCMSYVPTPDILSYQCLSSLIFGFPLLYRLFSNPCNPIVLLTVIILPMIVLYVIISAVTWKLRSNSKDLNVH